MPNPFYYDAGVHALHAVLKLASPFSAKIRLGLRGRAGLTDRIAAFGRLHSGPIWFHVASSGELEQAIPVMDELKRLSPETSLLVTYFSPSGKKAVALEADRRAKRGLSVPWDHADYSPLDASAALRRFFVAAKPRLLVLVHRELWPGLLNAARTFGVPAALVSSYWPRRPSRRDGKKLSHLKWLGTVDESSAEKIRGAARDPIPVEPVGDPRAERVLLRKSWNEMEGGDPAAGATPLWLLASLHDRDIAALSDLPFRLKDRPIAWVAVPHETDAKTISRLQRWLAPLGRVSRWSETGGELPTTGALIVDQVGFLAELYVKASVVLVGGSYDARVHNVWEPAVYHKPILTGPHIQNSAEALALKEKNLLRVCPDSAAVERELAELLADPTRYHAVAQGMRVYLDEQRGISRRYAEKLLTL